MGFKQNPRPPTPAALLEALDKAKVTLVVEWNNSIRLKFDGPLTYKMLAAVAEYFGSDAIDIDGRHGEGSYDVGLEVKLTIYNATKNVLSGST